MVTSHIKAISGTGGLYFGDLLSGKPTYEIQVTRENGETKVFGHFDGKPRVLRMQVTLDPSLTLKSGKQIKLRILGNPASDHVEFDVVDDASIRICEGEEAD